MINHVANYARRYQDGTQYFILLIITDGIITDMPQTKQVNIQSILENDCLTFLIHKFFYFLGHNISVNTANVNNHNRSWEC